MRTINSIKLRDEITDDLPSQIAIIRENIINKRPTPVSLLFSAYRQWPDRFRINIGSEGQRQILDSLFLKPTNN